GCAYNHKNKKFECKTRPIGNLLKGDKNSVVTLGDPLTHPTEHIKTDIFLHGPIATTYMVFADFIVGSSPDVYDDADGFKKTRGIYVNVPNMKIYRYGTISSKSCVKCLDNKTFLCDCN